MRFEGKVVVVTGAGSGMGRAMVGKFAAEGAKVVAGELVAARLDEVVQEIEAAGGTVTGVRADVAQRQDVETLVQTAIDTYGGLDVLVNNAGIMDLFEGVANVSDETWHKVMDVNAYGPMVASRAAVRYMKEHGGGAIVNVASAAGVGGGAAGAAYTMSKHALVGLTRSTAFVYAQQAIRCNAILAGGVATSIMAGLDMSKADQEALGQLGKWHAVMPASLEAADIANLALFLASDDAKMINGALVAADAGWSAA